MKSITRQLKQVLALVVAWNCAFGSLFAQRIPLTVKQQQALMTVIERIDADSTSADDWLKRSQEGLAEIRAVWESAAIDLAGRELFLASVEHEFERAYAERLTESFFGADAQKEQTLYQSLMSGNTASVQTAGTSFEQLAARFPELARSAANAEALMTIMSRRDTTLETAVVIERSERSAIPGTDETILSMVRVLDTQEARSSWLSATSSASRKESEALLAACAGADERMKQVIEQGLSYLTGADAVLLETLHAALDQQAGEIEDSFYRAGYFHADLRPDSAALVLYARFTAEKSSWIQAARAELASPSAERGLLAEDARVIARTYEVIHIPMRRMSEVMEDQRKTIRLLEQASADTVVPDANDTNSPLQLAKPMVEQKEMEKVKERTRSKERIPLPAELIVLYIEQPKTKRRRRKDESHDDDSTTTASTDGMVSAEHDAHEKLSLQSPIGAPARKPIQEERGAKPDGMSKDDGFINDSFAEGKQSDTNRGKTSEPKKEQEEKAQPEKKTRGTGSGAALIDGEDTLETIKREARNTNEAVIKEAKQEEQQNTTRVINQRPGEMLIDGEDRVEDIKENTKTQQEIVVSEQQSVIEYLEKSEEAFYETNNSSVTIAVQKPDTSSASTVTTISAPPPLISATPASAPNTTQVGFSIIGSGIVLIPGTVNVAATPPQSPVQSSTSTAAVPETTHSGSNIIQTGVQVVKDAASTASNIITNAATSAVNTVVTGVQAAANTVSAIGDAIISGIVSVGNNIQTGIANTQQAITTGIDTFVNALTSSTVSVAASTASSTATTEPSTFTITASNGTTVTLYVIDSNNPVINQLVSQNDFSSGTSANATIASAGCNFLSIAAVGQMLVGEALTQAELLEIWNTAQQTDCTYQDNGQQVSGKIINEEGKVNNPDKLLDLVFDKLGISGVGVSVGWDKSRGDGEVIAKIIKGKHTNANGNTSDHFILADTNENTIYDPYNPDLSITNSSYREVFVYGK